MAALLAGDRLYGKHDEQIRTLIKEKDKLVEMGLDITFVNCMKLLDLEIRRLKEPECQVLGGQYKADKKMVKVYIPVQEYPDGNLIGRLIGKKGSTIQRIQNETCTRITIMDKGRECRGRGRIQKIGYLAGLRRSGRYGGLLGNISDDDSDDDTLTDDEDKNSTFLTIVPDFISEDYQKINDCLVKATAAVKRAMLPELPPDAPCWTRAVDEHVSDAAGQGTEDKDDGGVSTKSKSPENKSGTTFHYEQDAKILLNRLHEMWKEGEMCDVVLDLGTEQIPAHRVVLASLSPYFKTLFSTPFGEPSTQGQETVMFHELEPVAAKALVEFAYTRKLQVDSCNVQGLLSGASFLQLHKVKEACAASLSNELCPYNCVGISVFAHLHDLTALKQAADRMVVRNFLEVVEGGELLDVPFQPLLLPLLENKDIANAFPVQICEVALSWLLHNMADRERHVEQIAQMLPLGRVTPNYMNEVFSQKYKDLLQRPEFRDEIEQAKAINQNLDGRFCVSKETESYSSVKLGAIDIDREICLALDRELSDEDVLDKGLYVPCVKIGEHEKRGQTETMASAVSSCSLFISVCRRFDNSGDSHINPFQFTGNGESYRKAEFSVTDNRFLNSLLAASNSLLSVGGIGTARLGYGNKYRAEKDAYKVQDETQHFLVRSLLRGSKKDRNGRAFTSLDISSGKESTLPEMKFARMDLGTALYNGRVYAVGGGIMLHPDYSGGVDVDPNSVECFDMEGSACEWTTVQSMSNARYSTRAAVIGNRLFAIGGGVCELNKCTSTEKSDLYSLIRSRFALPLSAYDRQVTSYTVSYTSLKVVESYDHRTGQWTEMAPLQIARRGHGLVAYDERLYCAGGYDGNKCLDSVECYEPRMNRWYSVASLQTPRHGVALGVVNGTLYAVGGHSEYDKLISGDVDIATCPLFEMYDPWLDSWTIVNRQSYSYIAEKSCYCTSTVSLYYDSQGTQTKITTVGSPSKRIVSQKKSTLAYLHDWDDLLFDLYDD